MVDIIKAVRDGAADLAVRAPLQRGRLMVAAQIGETIDVLIDLDPVGHRKRFRISNARVA
jgi:hypothetical protein